MLRGDRSQDRLPGGDGVGEGRPKASTHRLGLAEFAQDNHIGKGHLRKQLRAGFVYTGGIEMTGGAGRGSVELNGEPSPGREIAQESCTARPFDVAVLRQHTDNPCTGSTQVGCRLGKDRLGILLLVVCNDSYNI